MGAPLLSTKGSLQKCSHMASVNSLKESGFSTPDAAWYTCSPGLFACLAMTDKRVFTTRSAGIWFREGGQTYIFSWHRTQQLTWSSISKTKLINFIVHMSSTIQVQWSLRISGKRCLQPFSIRNHNRIHHPAHVLTQGPYQPLKGKNCCGLLKTCSCSF